MLHRGLRGERVEWVWQPWDLTRSDRTHRA